MLTPKLFSSANNRLNDFNRARFIRADLNKRQTCPFKISQASGLFRSPEEYDKEPLTEKVCLYVKMLHRIELTTRPLTPLLNFRPRAVYSLLLFFLN